MIARLWHAAMDFLLPPLCLRCDAPVMQNQALCVTCWKEIRFVAPPFCAICGAPFDLPVEDGTLCAACLADPPAFTTARSAVLYDEASKPLVLRLKHADSLHPVPAMAEWMVRAGAGSVQQADAILPVPLHRWRLFTRRYNQSALLAQAIGAKTGLPVLYEALHRSRATESQGHRGRKERAANVRGAFTVPDPAALAGKRLLLVDDVLTSGATVSECARTLLSAGAAAVHILTFARVRVAD